MHIHVILYFVFQESREGRHCFAAAAGHHEHRKPDRSPRGERGPVRTLVLLHILPGFLPGILYLTAVLLSERRGQNSLCHVIYKAVIVSSFHCCILLSQRRGQNYLCHVINKSVILSSSHCFTAISSDRSEPSYTVLSPIFVDQQFSLILKFLLSYVTFWLWQVQAALKKHWTNYQESKSCSSLQNMKNRRSCSMVTSTFDLALNQVISVLINERLPNCQQSEHHSAFAF